MLLKLNTPAARLDVQHATNVEVRGSSPLRWAKLEIIMFNLEIDEDTAHDLVKEVLREDLVFLQSQEGKAIFLNEVDEHKEIVNAIDLLLSKWYE